VAGRDAPAPFVRRAQHLRSLHFSLATVQSRMDVRHPDALTLDYTRLMMGFLLLQPAPRHIAMLGLGGGSLAKFCHRHLPGADITVVEIDRAVIALRHDFLLPPDSDRFRVLEGDGAAYVAGCSASVDVLLVDGYDADGLAASISSPAFYADAARALVDGGVFVTNLSVEAHVFERQLTTIERALGPGTFATAATGGANRVVLSQHGADAPLVLPAPRRPEGFDVPAWNTLRRGFARLHAAARAHSPADGSTRRG
jgi:spermidine synthase